MVKHITARVKLTILPFRNYLHAYRPATLHRPRTNRHIVGSVPSVGVCGACHRRLLRVQLSRSPKELVGSSGRIYRWNIGRFHYRFLDRTICDCIPHLGNGEKDGEDGEVFEERHR